MINPINLTGTWKGFFSYDSDYGDELLPLARPTANLKTEFWFDTPGSDQNSVFTTTFSFIKICLLEIKRYIIQ